MATHEYQGLEQLQMEQAYSIGGLEAHGLTFEPAGALVGTEFVQDTARFEEFPTHDPVSSRGDLCGARSNVATSRSYGGQGTRPDHACK